MSCEIYDFNLRYDNSYRFEIDRLKEFETGEFDRFRRVMMNVIQVKHPSKSIKNDILTPFPTVDIVNHGIKFTYERPLRVRILLDGELEIYRYFMDWYDDINSLKYTHDLEVNEDPEIDSRATLKLFLLKGNGDYDGKYVLYYNCYPKSVSGLDLKSNSDDKEELYIDVEFMYDTFEYIARD